MGGVIALSFGNKIFAAQLVRETPFIHSVFNSGSQVLELVR